MTKAFSYSNGSATNGEDGGLKLKKLLVGWVGRGGTKELLLLVQKTRKNRR